MSRINRIQKRKVSDEIAGEIKRLITEGIFLPDHRLPSETELSNQFGVSRSSVREALSMLAAAEIVETLPGEGTYVRDVNISKFIHPLALSIVTEKQQTIHLVELRKIVEVGIVELAAIRRDENDIKEIRKALLNLGVKLELGEPEEADANFHMSIAIASKNPLLIQTFENLAQVMQQSMEYTYKEKNLLNVRGSLLQEHKDIFGCIENQDPEGAVLAIKRHLDKTLEHLYSVNR